MNDQLLSEQDAYAIGVEAYHDFYPLISMDVTLFIGYSLGLSFI